MNNISVFSITRPKILHVYDIFCTFAETKSFLGLLPQVSKAFHQSKDQDEICGANTKLIKNPMGFQGIPSKQGSRPRNLTFIYFVVQVSKVFHQSKDQDRMTVTRKKSLILVSKVFHQSKDQDFFHNIINICSFCFQGIPSKQGSKLKLIRVHTNNKKSFQGIPSKQGSRQNKNNKQGVVISSRAIKFFLPKICIITINFVHLQKIRRVYVQSIRKLMQGIYTL